MIKCERDKSKQVCVQLKKNDVIPFTSKLSIQTLLFNMLSVFVCTHKVLIFLTLHILMHFKHFSQAMHSWINMNLYFQLFSLDEQHFYNFIFNQIRFLLFLLLFSDSFNIHLRIFPYISHKTSKSSKLHLLSRASILGGGLRRDRWVKIFSFPPDVVTIEFCLFLIFVCVRMCVPLKTSDT